MPRAMLRAPASGPKPSTKGATMSSGAASTSRALWTPIGIALKTFITNNSLRTYVRFVCDGGHSPNGHNPTNGSLRYTELDGSVSIHRPHVRRSRGPDPEGGPGAARTGLRDDHRAR